MLTCYAEALATPPWELRYEFNPDIRISQPGRMDFVRMSVISQMFYRDLLDIANLQKSIKGYLYILPRGPYSCSLRRRTCRTSNRYHRAPETSNRGWLWLSRDRSRTPTGHPSRGLVSHLPSYCRCRSREGCLSRCLPRAPLSWMRLCPASRRRRWEVRGARQE